MFSKILIANRGEIAVRIMGTCKEMGISTVAVFSDVDAGALHVRRADEAYEIGPAAPRESYLNVEAVLRAARLSGAQAVHPGYGFLAESAAFAEAVLSAGLTWIGPPPEVIALLGDKMAAKAAARAAGVPIVPGYAGEDLSAERLLAESERLGLPVMLKAAGGGGGKGIRAVQDARTLPEAVEAARREAASAFGDDRVFLEKLLVRPRHVEVQILADAAGSVVSLGERDCSVQRRHQKVIEEAPSPALTPELRDAIGASARLVAEATGYVNAGTVEFLFDGESYYFLEVNTRIQVEHPVTELLTGLDIVRLQIEIAAGKKLGLTQRDIRPRGHAIEGRLYAEDPANHFLPSAGTIVTFRPPQGPGIRNDVGVEPGDGVPPFYDPILAKLIVHAESRDLAVGRLQDALDRLVVSGPATNHGFLRWIAEHPAFVAGSVDIEFVDREWSAEGALPPPREAYLAAALHSALGHAEAPTSDPWRARTGWRANGMPHRFTYEDRGDDAIVELERLHGGTWRARIDEETIDIGLLSSVPERIVFGIDATVHEAQVSAGTNTLTVVLDGRAFELAVPVGEDTGRGPSMRAGDSGLTAPMPATVVKVVVSPGQKVGAREPLVILEAMKMEHVVEAPHAGTVAAILFREGDLVQAGAPLVRLDP